VKIWKHICFVAFDAFALKFAKLYPYM